MNKYHDSKKLAAYILMVSAMTLINANSCFAKAHEHKTQTPPATSIERTSVMAKHKLINEKIKPALAEAVDVAAATQKAIIALEKKDNKSAANLLKEVSAKLDGILAKNPGMMLVPADVETDALDFKGSNKDIANAMSSADKLLKTGQLQSARQVLAPLGSEIRITTISIPLGTYPAAIKQVVPLIEAGKIDQAAVDLNNALDTLVITTELMPLPVLRAEELLTVAADLEHTDDLSQDKNRIQIKNFTDAAKTELERAQLLGYGNKNDYQMLYQEIDAIHKTLFTEKSAAAWQIVKNEIARFKDRLKGLEDVVSRIGHPAQ